MQISKFVGMELWLAFNIILALAGMARGNLKFAPGKYVFVEVNADVVVNEVDPRFLSYCVDSDMFDPNIRWLKFNFSSVKLHTLLNSLSPAYFRVGGYPADYLFFDIPYNLLNGSQVSDELVYMTKEDVINLVELTKSTGSRLIFDLNLQLRFGKKWDPSNAILLMEFLSQNGYGDNIDWQLGNEPSYWANGVTTPEQIAKDFRILHNLIRQYPLMNSSVISGPDIITVNRNGLVYLEALSNYSGDIVKALSFHHYYLRGDKATYETYLDPMLFKNLDDVIDMIEDSQSHTTHPSLPKWIGETSDGWNGGTPNVSDRFVSGFLWMEKLGLSAKRGIKVVARQTLYGHSYPLLDIDMSPNPDFWLSWLHKKLVGQKVFQVHYEGDLKTRVYSHCTKTSQQYDSGSLTVFALNVDPNNFVSLLFEGDLKSESIHLYLVEPDDSGDNIHYARSKEVPMLSKWSKLNGRRLELINDYTMPDLIPEMLKPETPVVLPPLTYAFIVFPDAHIHNCL